MGTSSALVLTLLMASTTSMPSMTLAEHAVAVAVGGGLAVEGTVVLGVDEELRRGAVGLVRAGHGKGAAQVLLAVVGLILDGIARPLFFAIHGDAATLVHEALDDAMKNPCRRSAWHRRKPRSLDRDGRVGFVQLDLDVAHGRLDDDNGMIGTTADKHGGADNAEEPIEASHGETPWERQRSTCRAGTPWHCYVLLLFPRA